jgi:hypothetical protein
VKIKAYLVLAQHATTGKVSARKVTKHYPALEWNEAVVLLELDVPDDLFEAPLVTVPVEKRLVQVAAEVEEIAE